MGVRGIIVYCANYACSHSIPVSADHWPDDLRLSDIEQAASCGRISIGIGSPVR